MRRASLPLIDVRCITRWQSTGYGQSRSVRLAASLRQKRHPLAPLVGLYQEQLGVFESTYFDSRRVRNRHSVKSAHRLAVGLDSP